MKEKQLILVGGGGHCKAVIDVAMAAGRPIMGIIDESLAIDDSVVGVSVIGRDNDIKEIVAKHGDSVEFLITVGHIKSSAIRVRIANAITLAGGAFATPLIAPSAHIAIGAQVGRGTVVMHNAVVNTHATIGDNSIINTGAIVEHDCTVGDFVHISTGAIVNGMSTIGNDCFIGSHATIAHVTKVAPTTVVGAGAVVVKDIDEAGTYCGVPAKRIK